MKKKLEAELISIAHRILKLKNRSELDQLQQETLKLYEKLSVLRFVEDNFNEVKPTIGYASAEAKLEEVYGLQPEAPEKEEAGKEAEKTDDIKDDKRTEASDNKDDNVKETDEVKQDKENENGEGSPTEEGEKAPVSEEEKEYTQEETDEQVKEPGSGKPEQPDNKNTEQQPEKPDAEKPEQDKPEEQPEARPEGDANPDQKVEEYQASEQEKQHTEEKKDEEEDDEKDTPAKEPEVEEEPEQQELPKVEEPPKQQARPQFNFDFGSREASQKQKEITFEDYHKDYKEPEFVKKSEAAAPVSVQKEWLPKEPEVLLKQEQKTQNMWDTAPAQPVQQSYMQQPPAQAFVPPTGETTGKTIALGLNDRIAFEKNLFNGSGEDLNRVLSQLNTFERFTDARNFIEDLVKPDYNNWKGKEEYEERLMALVEQKFK